MHPIRSTLRSIIAVAAIGAIAACADQAVPTGPAVAGGSSDKVLVLSGPVLNPINNHYYEVLRGSHFFSYWGALAIAADRQYLTCTSSHLITLQDAQEGAFAAALAGNGAYWAGAIQPVGSPEPAANWQWITGEPFTYTPWRNSGEPNNGAGFPGAENVTYIQGGVGGQAGTIVDFPEFLGSHLDGMVVEYEGCAPSNQAPTVSAPSPTVNEGGSVTLTATGNDPDGDALTYVWTVNGVDQPAGASLTQSYTDNGSFSYSVTVTDGKGGSASATSTVTVLNVAPAPSITAPSTIILGESYVISGSFTDPGADTHTGSVQFGSEPPLALALSNGSFTSQFTFTSTGTHAIVVAIADDDGGVGTATATLVVQSAAQAVASLQDVVNALAGADAGPLNASLQAAIASLAAGNETAAAGQLNAFINKAEAQRGKKFSDSAVDTMVGRARRVMATFGPKKKDK